MTTRINQAINQLIRAIHLDNHVDQPLNGIDDAISLLMNEIDEEIESAYIEGYHAGVEEGRIG